MKDICDNAKRNGSLTKSDINNNSGKYPVYTASVGKVTGYINSYTNTQPSIIIPTAGNGSAGKPYIVEDNFYTIGANAVGFVPKAQIDILFIYYQLRDKLSTLVKGESFKNITQTLIENIEISLPVTNQGLYDLEEQQRLANIYYEIEDKKKKLLKRIYEIENLTIQLDKETDIEYKDVPLNKIVEHNNGASKYTKQWCKDNRGEFPVYSANNNEPISYINHYDYDGEYLTYSKNGCAGYISIINGKFSVNGDRCVMSKNEEFKDKVDIMYLKYYLEPIFRFNKKGRIGDLGKNEFTKLNSTMIKKINIQVPIPIKSDGTFDLEKQKEIANKYRQIDEIKQGLIEKIKTLVEIKIIPN